MRNVASQADVKYVKQITSISAPSEFSTGRSDLTRVRERREIGL